MALCSKVHNKPFYVVAESFKFVRLYPLNQQDVPDKFKVQLSSRGFKGSLLCPCVSSHFLLSIRPTLWRQHTTSPRSTQWSTTRLPPSSPSSSPTSEFSHPQPSAMNSLSCIYDSTPSTPNKVCSWRVKKQQKLSLAFAARQTSSFPESSGGSPAFCFAFSLPVIPLSKSSSLIFPFLSLLRRRASFKSSFISSLSPSESFGQMRESKKGETLSNPISWHTQSYADMLIVIPHRVSFWLPSFFSAPSCSFAWTRPHSW